MTQEQSKAMGDARAKASAAAIGAAKVLQAHREEPSGELFGITELCEACGVTPRALRFYEDRGLLAPRRVNGARVYTRRDRARLALILRSKAIGATLDEIKHYLDMYGAHGEGREQQLRYVLERTAKAMEELVTKREHIEATIAELKLIHDGAREALAARGAGNPDAA